MYSPHRLFSLHPWWLKLRLKKYGIYFDYNVILQFGFVDFSEQLPVCSTRGAVNRSLSLSVPPRSHAYIYRYIYYILYIPIISP